MRISAAELYERVSNFAKANPAVYATEASSGSTPKPAPTFASSVLLKLSKQSPRNNNMKKPVSNDIAENYSITSSFQLIYKTKWDILDAQRPLIYVINTWGHLIWSDGYNSYHCSQATTHSLWMPNDDSRFIKREPSWSHRQYRVINNHQ